MARNDLVDPISESESTQACRREDQAVVATSIQFLESGNDVAANVLELKMGEVVPQLSQSAQ